MTHYEEVLTERNQTRILHRFMVAELFCARCGQVVQLGSPCYVKYPVVPDPLDPRLKGRKGHAGRIYHEKCWEELFYDLGSK
jgi:hypothetical protein